MMAQYDSDKTFKRKWEEISGYYFWQLGVTKQFRIIGILDDNIFRMLIIDSYHMIYLNKKLYDDKVMSYKLSIL